MMVKIWFFLIVSLCIPNVVHSCVLRISKSINHHNLPFLFGITNYDNEFIAIGGVKPTIYTFNENVEIKASKEIIDNFYGFEIKDISIQKFNDKNNIIFILNEYNGKNAGMVYTLEGKQELYRELSLLYKKLAIKTKLASGENINISGMVSDKNNVYLITNSSSNNDFLFSIPKVKFENYIINNHLSLDDIYVYPADLPIKNGIKAQLSSIAIDEKENALYVTATVNGENDILGNYYGSIYLEYIKPGRAIKLNYDAIEIKYDKQPLLEKIKSIAVTSNNNKEIKGILLSHNRDGTSKVFDFSFKK
nr:hypothetical protein [Photobacterium kishitanii]